MRKLGKKLSQVERSVEAYGCNCFGLICGCNCSGNWGQSATGDVNVTYGVNNVYSTSLKG